MTGLMVETTAIPGLLVVRLPVRHDPRGWFKESWQRAKMLELGVPDFGPVQHNVSFNAARGTTRGIHAEPWDKFVSLTAGRAYGAWVDLRAGDTWGTTVTLDLDPSVAVFVPRGVGNSYQTLEDATTYSYLVNEHWSEAADYLALALDDPTAAIAWPIPLAECEISAKDRANPTLDRVTPMAPPRTLILGASGLLGRALARAFPDADRADRADLDLTDPARLAAWPWRDYDVVLNASAHTDVDGAETPAGRAAAWAANATAPAALARLADEHRFTLVHFSTDYVFDGDAPATGYGEDAPLAPLGVYGQSKAAGDLAVSTTPRHYLVRTSWVVGDGPGFVATMRDLAARGVSPTVVDDQVGRLTFTDELARVTRHLLAVGAPFGTYNATNSGTPMSWRAIAAEVFELTGRRRDDVIPVTTEEYAAGRATAPRPAVSTLDLKKLRSTGFEPTDQLEALAAHCRAADAGAER